MSEQVLLKLGGSVITDKGSPGVADHAAMESIAREIARHPLVPVLVVHGAGSFGHPEAQRYGLARGADRSNREGISLTHEAVGTLNQMMVRALREAGLEAVGIHPLAGSYARAGRLESMEVRPLQNLMELGIVPVLHGDVVMDAVQGACIVSGDQIVRYLGTRLPFTRAGLVTDVPGVLSRDGSVIPCLTPENHEMMAKAGSRHTDVTGGMEGKVKELLEMAAGGTPAEIFHISRLGDFMDGKPHGGTTIRSVSSGWTKEH
jgi:isopentenyl phosphate kinase